MTQDQINKQLALVKAARLPIFHGQMMMREAGVTAEQEAEALRVVYNIQPKSIQQQTVEMAERVVLRNLADRMLGK